MVLDLLGETEDEAALLWRRGWVELRLKLGVDGDTESLPRRESCHRGPLFMSDPLSVSCHRPGLGV